MPVMMTSSGEGCLPRDDRFALTFVPFFVWPEGLDFMHWIVAFGDRAWTRDGLPSEIPVGLGG